MNRLAEDLRVDLPERFKSEEYEKQKKALTDRFTQRRRELLSQIEEKAREKKLGVVKSMAGLSLVPLKDDGSPLPGEEFERLSQEERKEIHLV